MKTALTVWGKWISPVFDSAQTILIAEIENGSIVNRQLFTFEAEHPSSLAKLLKNQEVAVLICGAISEYPARVLENESLAVVPFITGNTEAILQTLARGKPIVPCYLMPGCKVRNFLRQTDGNGSGKAAPGNTCCRKKR
jgi:predicted Fe-Mo cluster-binding NifX family protein